MQSKYRQFVIPLYIATGVICLTIAVWEPHTISVLFSYFLLTATWFAEQKLSGYTPKATRVLVSLAGMQVLYEVVILFGWMHTHPDWIQLLFTFLPAFIAFFLWSFAIASSGIVLMLIGTEAALLSLLEVLERWKQRNLLNKG